MNMYVINYCVNQLNNYTNHKKEKNIKEKYYRNKKRKEKERKNVSGRWDSNRHLKQNLSDSDGLALHWAIHAGTK